MVSNDNISNRSLIVNILFSLEHYSAVYKLVRDNEIDLVHVHNFFPLLSPSVFKAAKDAGAKVVHTLHSYRISCISGMFYRPDHGICQICSQKKFPLAGVFYKCYRSSLLQSFFAQVAFSFYRCFGLYNSIDYFFVLTKFQKKILLDLGMFNSKLILKPNFTPYSAKLKTTVPKSNDYIFIGRLEHAKGIFLLLDTWLSLDESFVINVIGSGPEEKWFRTHYEKNNIIFWGSCSYQFTQDKLSNCKYLIQPSLWYETFGLTIIEAMRFGIPVIGLDIGTRRDFIQNKINGFLSDENSFKKSITLSSDYFDYERLSQNALKTAREFEETQVIDKQIEIYRSIIQLQQFDSEVLLNNNISTDLTNRSNIGQDTCFLSIITVCYNNLHGLERTAASILPLPKGFEWLIIDGCSTDGTRDFLVSLPVSNAIRFLVEPDKGIYDAMNKGILLSKGLYVNFMNSGDLFIRSSLESIVAEQNAIADIILYNCSSSDVYGKPVYTRQDPDNINEIKKWACLQHQSSLIKRSVFNKTGLYSLDFKYLADYEHSVKAYLNSSITISFQPQLKLANFIYGGVSTEYSNSKNIAFEYKKIQILYFGKYNKLLFITNMLKYQLGFKFKSSYVINLLRKIFLQKR